MRTYLNSVAETTATRSGLGNEDLGFADVWVERRGRIERADADPQEANEPDLAELPRLRFRFDRHGHSRFRQMIDLINRSD